MNRVKTFVNKNKPDVNLSNFSNTLQNFKTKITNITFNNEASENNGPRLVRSRSIRSISSTSSKSSNKSNKSSFVKNISNSIFSSNKENYCSNNFNINDKKDVSRVSSFAANHPSIAKKGFQVAAYASGDKELAKKIGQTSTKDIANTASKINKGANFVVENQDTINEFNRYTNGNNNSNPLNKFINSSAISNSSANSTTHSSLPSSFTSQNSSNSSRISAPPPLPGRVNNDVRVTRNNSTSVPPSRSINTEKLARSNTIGSPSPINNTLPNTTKFNKPPPPPVPRHKPDLDKMTEVITSSAAASNATSKNVAAPPPLPNRPAPSKLKRSGSDSKLLNEAGNEAKNKTNTISRGNTDTQHSPFNTNNTIKTQFNNNDCANEISRIFKITMPMDNVNRYANVFIQIAENNLVTDATVKAIWMQSGIPKSTLAKIWTYVNRKLDGLLEKSEFIVGMYLIDQYLNGYDIEYYFNI
ncbi:hypothetical protein BCR36DRAFT_583072 [Piromyces finnis]|uniref:EH domain-containing protein n=1 Tax=Piromyces finnis TaxID=1754191 RepID=A0A1Y1VAU1_9FUNG|nr:hypothetical protein BCR36DRAFT_583072 [Piromyces finnis]|eukprot:ORX51001.1 hypothetical protein BCR36DRAFT_583072 [Piromyces finnis]